MYKPVFVISCPIDVYSGYSQRSRDIVKSIIELDLYDVQILPQSWGACSHGFIESNKEWDFLTKHILPNPQLTSQPDIWMQITIPSEFQAIGKYNIGCTAGIESTGCDPSWIEGLNKMDMNWVSSNHSKGVFTQNKFEQRDKQSNQVVGIIELKKPIHVIFEGIDLDVYKFLPPTEVNLDLSDIKEEFCFLFVGHWMEGHMGHDRKNVGLLVKYFFETFKNTFNPPALILKTSTGRESYMSRETIMDRILTIKNEYKGDRLPNIYILNGNLSNNEINQLYNHPKVKTMISLTKGEGYGRPLAEFCLSKKPVIATGWSGHTDFLDPLFTIALSGVLEQVHESAANQWLRKETQWFQVNEKHTISAMKEMFKNYKKFLEPSKRQGFKIKSTFGYGAMKELVSNILKNNIPLIPQQLKLNLPLLQTPKL